MPCVHAQEPGEIAGEAAEAMRKLNQDPAVLRYAADVYAVLGNLSILAERLPQICRQLTRFLEGELDADRVTVVEGQPFARDPEAAVATAAHWLVRASRAAGHCGPA